MPPRDEEVQYEQDRFGNERRKLDRLRASEGSRGQNTEEGIRAFDTDTTGVQVLFSLPTRAQRAIVTRTYGFNSVGSGDNTFSLWELDLDSNGNITGSTRSSIPIVVGSGSTRIEEHDGEPYQKAIGASAEFGGYVGVGVVVDHDEAYEPDAEQTTT